ncbi:L-threonylcarbamoyladenylate synthase [Myxococcota bacterium]|nr:L-threonylcarbamoyladenylate synthase [Myxococcota bacterium]
MIADPLGEATRSICAGGLIAYPTETVWGLAVDANNPDALEALRAWKGRGEDQPISILVHHADALSTLGFGAVGCAQALAKRFWPGPLTLVLPCSTDYPQGIAREDGAVGVRCSSHPLTSAWARRLWSEGSGPVTATSLNRTGDPPARTRSEASILCSGDEGGPKLLEVEGAESGGDEPSTVIDLTGEEPHILRWGAIGPEELLPVIEETRSRWQS